MFNSKLQLGSLRNKLFYAVRAVVGSISPKVRHLIGDLCGWAGWSNMGLILTPLESGFLCAEA